MLSKPQTADAAANDAREKVGYGMYHFMYATLLNLRGLPEIIEQAVVFLHSLANELSMGKGMAEKNYSSDSLQLPCDVENSQDTLEDGVNKKSSQDTLEDGGSKRARFDESWTPEMGCY